MTFRAVFFDLGGVIVRTEYQAPRERLADQLGMEYEDLVRAVFDSDSALKASVGTITEDEHWNLVARKLGCSETETAVLRSEFFAGDVIDHKLLEFIRSLKSHYKTGLISNAWSGLRSYIVSKKFDDAFDNIIISAEVGSAKPEAKIFRLALKQAQVSAEETIFVDDFPENVDAARALGLAAIRFRDS
ncbi:MAG TPA: HAD family phosphatase, partial [Anaerolineales bacterium]|nr:HAD family phosphatase [Anaerolineales bacterium]